MSVPQIAERLDKGPPLEPAERNAAVRTLRIMTHPNCRASRATREEAFRLFHLIEGKAPAARPRRMVKRPQEITAAAIARAKVRVLKALEETGLLIVTADTPALLAAADEIVSDGMAQAVSDRFERVRGGPMAAGSSARRERRVLKLVGDARI